MSPVSPDPDPEPLAPEPTQPWREFARAPLVPVAVAATIGLIADRSVGVPTAAGIGLLVGGMIGWAVFHTKPTAVVWLWVAVAGLAAAYHHAHRHEFPPDDIARFAQADAVILTVRGVLADEPITRRHNTTDPLAPSRRTDLDVCTLDVTEVESAAGWHPASGRVRLWVERDLPTAAPPLNGLRSGDTVQAVGRFAVPQPPGNPGERDYYDFSLDRRIRGDLRASDTSAAVVRLDAGGWGVSRVMAWIRNRSTATLIAALGEAQAPVGRALLLGDGTAMDRAEWDAFVRTGVVHVLAISGQHLVVLAAFVWFVLGASGMPRRKAAWVVAAVVCGYAVLTGLRPSALRAAVMVSALCGAIVLRRPVFMANSFALAWVVVAAVNPTDPFDLGCRLSFLSVFCLVWGVGRWVQPKRRTPLERLIDESRSLPERVIRALIRAVAVLYVINLALFLVNAPLLIAEQNIVSPVSLFVGPVLVLLTSVALVCGFLLLLLAPVPVASDGLAALTRWSLAVAERCVHWADGVVGGSAYLPGLPFWWLVGFYLLVVVVVLLGLKSSRWFQLALFGWAFVAAVLPTSDHPADEFRMAFLSVGHGGCVVMETPDGRCLIYDAGTTAGPDAVRRVVAPYLWHRGVRRIDEIFVSHADADHFNGLGQLLRRFPVGRVTVTPSFAERPTQEVDETLVVLKRANVELRTAHAGQTFAAGEVTFEVLHPPSVGPPGIENERSLVLAVRHAGHTILLTGDLEKAGAGRLLGLPPVAADVLMAPHHGSKSAFPAALRAWANPLWVVVSRGDLYTNTITDADTGVPTWDTHAHGTLTVRSHPTGLTVEAFRTGRREVVRGK
jgi:competence protein ComEC